MSNSEKEKKEDLKKLEDEAYFELMQIIAEALQLQDIELLDYRISNWKNKYKRILDNPSPQFKKRVEFLLTQYYSSVTQYIMSQIKFKEQKMIENQAKALRELYVIIRDTNDLPLLKKKVAKWQEKYPISAFLKMYQKKVQSYTRQKNLEQNAFEQDKAFKELVDITKINGTFEELKEKFNEWEKTYSINDKYSIDDFIKHQSEIKRYSSDEYLRSIAREDPLDEKQTIKIDDIQNNSNEFYSNSGYSPLSTQAQAYASLLAIAKKSNNVDEIFDWVYKNRNTKFNDKYKELILSATYLDYSPKFLQSLPIPEIDITKNSLSLTEYKSMREIKRYSVISYFNLLLPPNKSFSNNYFNSYINEIYRKSKIEKSLDYKKDSDGTFLYSTEIMDSGVEIYLNKIGPKNENVLNSEIPLETSKSAEDSIKLAEVKKVAPEVTSDDSKVREEEIKAPEFSKKDMEEDKTNNENTQPIYNSIKPNLEVQNKPGESFKTISREEKKFKKVDIDKTITDEPQDFQKSDSKNELAFASQIEENSEDIVKFMEEKKQPIETFERCDDVSVESSKIHDDSENNIKPKEATSHTTTEDLDHDTLVALSPMFFSTINNFNKQAILVSSIDETTTKYINSIERENDQTLDLNRSKDNNF